MKMFKFTTSYRLLKQSMNFHDFLHLEQKQLINKLEYRLFLTKIYEVCNAIRNNLQKKMNTFLTIKALESEESKLQ